MQKVHSIKHNCLCTALKPLQLGEGGRKRQHRARRSPLQEADLKSKPPILIQYVCCIACKGIIGHIQVLDGAVLKACTASLVHTGPPASSTCLGGTWPRCVGLGEGGTGIIKMRRSLSCISFSLPPSSPCNRARTRTHTHAHTRSYKHMLAKADSSRLDFRTIKPADI